MKQISFGIVLSVIAVFITAIILTINTRTSREQELTASVDAALSSTLDKASLDAVSGEYSDEGMAGLAEAAIRKNITTPKNDKNFAIDINIIKADVKNGLLSANVKETYTNPNGNPITIETTRTVAVESECEKKPFRISYRFTSNDAEQFHVPALVADYTVLEGDNVPVPSTSKFSGYVFKGFYDKDTGFQYASDDLSQMIMDKSMNGKTLYLIYKRNGSTKDVGKLITVRMKPAFANGNTKSEFDVQGKEGGSSGGGDYIYKFGYNYCKEHQAIELSVKIYKINGDLYSEHDFHSGDDDFELNTSYPSLMNDMSIDKAIQDMITDRNITDYDVEGVKKRINEKYGYSEDKKKIWSYPLSNGKRYYLLFVTADSLEINEDVTLTVYAGTGVESTYGSGTYPKNTVVKYGGVQAFGYSALAENEILLDEDKVVTVEAEPWKHNIHFEGNGGNNIPMDFTKTYGKLEMISEAVPTRNGFHFDYWSASDGRIFHPGNPYGTDQDGGIVTLTAHWNSGITYDTVTGLSNLYPSVSVNSFDSDSIIDGQAISVVKKPTVKYKDNDIGRSVIFIGWNTDMNGNGTWYAYNIKKSNGAFSYSGSDITLYAQYRLQYDVFYDGNGQTVGDNFFSTIKDNHILSSPESKFTFKENIFSKYENKNEYDDNLKMNVPVTVNYSYQGWSLNKNAYFTDLKVYNCANERRYNKLQNNASKADYNKAGKKTFLAESLDYNPCDNIQISDSYITVTTYAVWDKFPKVSAYDIGLVKEKIEKYSTSKLKYLIIKKSRAVSSDYEDSTRPVGNPKIRFLNFKKADYLPKGDFGSSKCTFMVTDDAGNTSFYQIDVFITSENFEKSQADTSQKSVMYKRFIDKENFSKSFRSYNNGAVAILGISDRKKAHADGGMEAYSKWLLSDECREEMKKTLAS